MPTPADLTNRFTYHPPTGDGQPAAYELLRDAGHELAMLVDRLAPQGREQSLAMTNIEQAVMWANAAIARDGLATSMTASEVLDNTLSELAKIKPNSALFDGAKWQHSPSTSSRTVTFTVHACEVGESHTPHAWDYEGPTYWCEG